MQGEPTPLKKPMRANQLKADFTSGKQNRKVYVTVVSAQRKDQVISNYRPLVNIMPQQSNPQQKQETPQTIDKLQEEMQRFNNSIAQKLKSIQQLQQSNPAAYQQISQMIAQLRAKKQHREELQDKLMRLKKANTKAAHRFQLQQQKTVSQAQKIRVLIKKQEQSVYQLSGQIYEKEKERNALNAEVDQLDATYIETKSQISEQLIQLEQLKGLEKEEGDQMQRLTATHGEVIMKVKESTLHASILKIQVNPHLRVSFEAQNSSLSTRKRILDKNPNLWQKKNKILQPEEIRYYLIIQLYPGWRRLLDRLSYRFTGYRELFLQQAEQSSVLEELDDYIFSNPKIIKYKSSIVIYSQRSEPYEEILDILMGLVGLRNCFIEILDVVFEKTGSEGVEKASISYTFKGQHRVKSYEVIRLRELTREVLQLYMPSNSKPDRTCLLKIEIPSYFESPAERIRLEDIYRMIERG